MFPTLPSTHVRLDDTLDAREDGTIETVATGGSIDLTLGPRLRVDDLGCIGLSPLPPECDGCDVPPVADCGVCP